MGKSSWSSLASRAANRSNTSFMTATGRASGRSTLLITTMGWSPTLSALDTTNLVGGGYQDQRAVHPVEDALDLAAEIGMARRVDDVDARIRPRDRGDFGKNGDA